MKQIADITLIENSSANNPPKVFKAQTVEIRFTDNTTHMSNDGILATARHPSTVTWYDGKKAEFDHITDVLIVAPDGTVLMERALLLNFMAPHDVAGGVQFQVL